MENVEFAYQIMSASYAQIQSKKDSSKKEELYPVLWSSVPTYEEKIQILSEAIESGRKIEETESYSKYVEGVVQPKTR